jgi:hypothetical protein
MIKKIENHCALLLEENMKINKKYKDSVFRLLFNSKEKSLELFNVIFDTDYTDPDAIEIITFDDVLYMGIKNDLSFILYDILALIEHQSTLNENMPVRMLMYLNRHYEKIIKGEPKKIFGRSLVEIPNSVFIVLYNGKEDFPAEKTLRLSTLNSFSGSPRRVYIILTNELKYGSR